MAVLLYADLREEVYVEQPTGFSEDDEKVCLLLKALYGLKQSPRDWYGTLLDFLLSLGFVRSQYDSCLFLLQSDQGIVLMGVYVDEIQIMGSRSMVDWIKVSLLKKYKATDLGAYTYYLGMRMERNRSKGTIKISHPGHIDGILNSHMMSEANPQSTPMEANANSVLLNAPEGYTADPSNVTAFKSGLGQLMFLMVRTRPDIAFAVCKLSTFSNNPTDSY